MQRSSQQEALDYLDTRPSRHISFIPHQDTIVRAFMHSPTGRVTSVYLMFVPVAVLMTGFPPICGSPRHPCRSFSPNYQVCIVHVLVRSLQDDILCCIYIVPDHLS